MWVSRERTVIKRACEQLYAESLCLHNSSSQEMASEEPLFDASLKKRKKKTVAFSEDPLGADADPTQPAPTTIDTQTTNGEVVDLGPTTVHEQMKQSSDTKEEGDDFKAMFGDLKKKKKKKEIPMDLVSGFGLREPCISSACSYKAEEGSGTSTPATAPPVAAAEDLDFSDLKKKKKSSKKKAAFDLEAFEREFNETKPKEGDKGAGDGTVAAEAEEGELGEDPFARPDAPTGVDAGNEPWLKSDRDYTYPEVRFVRVDKNGILRLLSISCCNDSTPPFTPPTHLSSHQPANDTP